MEISWLQMRTWAQVDLDALKHNYINIRNRVSEQTKLCCIIKADAYGHGSVRVAKLYESLGADYLAVSNIEEALVLRNSGIMSPILILGYTHPLCAEVLSTKNITQCVYSYEYANALKEQAMRARVKIRIHIKVDVGMGRLGFVVRDSSESALLEILEVCKNDCFDVEGIFTHFPMADNLDVGKKVTQKQFLNFLQAVASLEEEGISFKIKHCCNSAATFRFPEFNMDMVRVGIALYGGFDENRYDGQNLNLKNTISLKTVISNIKSVRCGEKLGYDSAFSADRDMIIATLPIGYADGFKRENYDNDTLIFVKGQPCRITGKVCMDQIMIDVSGIEGVGVGDEVTIYGSGSEIDLIEFSKRNHKIPYETMCEISARVPRVYVSDGKIIEIRDSLV